MIDPKKLTDKDIGRLVVWRDKDEGVLTSWNDLYVFVKFRGPNGEACYPQDVSFVNFKGAVATKV